MSITLDQLEQLLKAVGIEHYQRDDARSCVVFGMTTEHYARPDGQKSLLVVAEVSENGEYFKLFAPMAYKVEGKNLDPFLRTCMIIQWMTKLVQFEYDSTDGEIRPIIEFPIEDGSLTAKQLGRSVGGLVQLIEQYSEELHAALEQGVVLDQQTMMIDQLEALLERLKRDRKPPPEKL